MTDFCSRVKDEIGLSLIHNSVLAQIIWIIGGDQWPPADLTGFVNLFFRFEVVTVIQLKKITRFESLDRRMFKY